MVRAAKYLTPRFAARIAIVTTGGDLHRVRNIDLLYTILQKETKP